MTCSIPLSGESRPNVRITGLPFDAEPVLAATGERHVGNAVRNEVDLALRRRRGPSRSSVAPPARS